mmetsp:Transcript_16185/g.45885  ORF Transcript_16185/g.45885 Transcript_16185/m.45885 type:complete len:116 (+) Transcript_16185:907-1254(+)
MYVLAAIIIFVSLALWCLGRTTLLLISRFVALVRRSLWCNQTHDHVRAKAAKRWAKRDHVRASAARLRISELLHFYHAMTRTACSKPCLSSMAHSSVSVYKPCLTEPKAVKSSRS